MLKVVGSIDANAKLRCVRPSVRMWEGSMRLQVRYRTLLEHLRSALLMQVRTRYLLSLPICNPSAIGRCLVGRVAGRRRNYLTVAITLLAG
jgi:hypothetical protein